MKKINLLKAVLVLSLPVALAMFSFKPTGTGYNVGDTVKDFNLKNVDGKNISLSGMKNNKGAIVIFTCNHCPFSVAYEDRIIALHNKYAAKGYPVIAINPNDDKKVPEDSFDNMVVRAKEKKFPFSYLHDPSQATARHFGAARTPHVYLLTKTGNDYKVEYIGAIDNNTDEPEAVTQKYVESAMEDVLAGKPVTTNFTKAIGCTIKWKS